MHTLRRHDLAISEKEAWQLIKEAEIGFLATADKKGNPYGIVLNHVAGDDCLYFHSAEEGRKMDHIKENPQVTYTVVPEHKVLPEKKSASYKSAVVFGKALIVTDEKEKRKALKKLMEKYSPGYDCAPLNNLAEDMKTGVVKIVPEQITGKQSADRKK